MYTIKLQHYRKNVYSAETYSAVTRKLADLGATNLFDHLNPPDKE